MVVGLMIWALGFALTIFHDDELREIRRVAARNNARRAAAAESSTGKNKISNGKADGSANGVDKFYIIPKNGAFSWILYPHYLFEWLEWTGFWIMGGSAFGPGMTFVVNEIATMLPRAVRGKWWYEERFGKEKMEGRMAIIPGLI